MKKSLIIILALIMFSNLFTGCWSKRELNELAIAAALGIDKTEDGYLLSVQLMNPGEITANRTGASSPVLTFRTIGRTIFEALRRLTVESPRRIYLAHIRVVIIGEELAREGISDILDFLSRDHEFRTDFYILVAKDEKAETVISMLTLLEEIPANKILGALETSEKVWAATQAIQLDELVNDLVSEGKNPVVTGILLKGNPDIGINLENIRNTKLPALIKIGNLAVFKKDKLIDWLSEAESIGYNVITDNIKASVTTITFPEEGTLTIEVTKSETKVKSKIDNGKPIIEVEVRGEGSVGEVQTEIDLTKTESISEIENAWKSIIEKRVRSVIEKAQQELETDIFGFGETIHRQHPTVWKNLKENWNEEFIDLPVEIKVETKIRRVGTITNPFKEAKE